MSKLIQRFRRRTIDPTPKKCDILEAPAEIRLAIYSQIAADRFLPHADYRNYMGLLLSCKQIRNEMEYEAVRAAPAILQAIQAAEPLRMLLRPLRPIDFTCLMHVTIGIPCWALYSETSQIVVLQKLQPLLQLHLSSLTIGLEDMPEDGVVDLTNLSHSQVMRLSRDWDRAKRTGRPPNPDYYNVYTTYADAMIFATRINCLVEPQLCRKNKHYRGTAWCLGTWNQWRGARCNVRKVVLRLKKLHKGMGVWPYSVYTGRSKYLPWHVAYEDKHLWRHGWRISWRDEKGKTSLFKVRDPAEIMWERRKGKHENGKDGSKGFEGAGGFLEEA